jgi:hypothetical protein
VCELVFQVRQQLAVDLNWQLQTQSFVWMDKDDKRKLVQTIKRLGERASDRKSVYDTVPEAVKIRMIGGAIAVRGQKWIKKHPRLVNELAMLGVSQDEAVRRHSEWLAEQRKSFEEG